MKVQTFDSRMRLLRIMLTVVWAVTFAAIASAQDEEKNIRKIQQGLPAGFDIATGIFGDPRWEPKVTLRRGLVHSAFEILSVPRDREGLMLQ